MASWIMKNVKDGSRRIKDELARSIGFASDGTLDPVLDYRMQRFNRYNDNLEKLSKAVGHYQEAAKAYSHACAHLSHAFSEFFESQLDAYDADHAPTKSLAQGALRLEEVFQSLRESTFDTALDLQKQVVTRSIQQLKQKNAGTQRQLQTLKQKLIEYDSVRRSAESQKKNTPDFERAQQRVQSTEAALVAMTNGINDDLNALEARRSVDMRNELLTVVASQMFLHSRAHEHLQQLLPVLPGIARPLMLLAEHPRARPRANPADATVMGVLDYSGAASRGLIDVPVSCAAVPMPTLSDPACVHPIPAEQPFAAMHFAEKLAVATYGCH